MIHFAEHCSPTRTTPAKATPPKRSSDEAWCCRPLALAARTGSFQVQGELVTLLGRAIGLGGAALSHE